MFSLYITSLLHLIMMLCHANTTISSWSDPYISLHYYIWLWCCAILKPTFLTYLLLIYHFNITSDNDVVPCFNHHFFQICSKNAKEVEQKMELVRLIRSQCLSQDYRLIAQLKCVIIISILNLVSMMILSLMMCFFSTEKTFLISLKCLP